MKKRLTGILALLLVGRVLMAQPQLKRGEYFFDTDPGQGNGTAIAFTAADSVNINTTISVSSLSPGFHKLFIRVYNDSAWSLYEGRGFYIQPSVVSTPAAQISNAEYFFDTDPGVGMGTALSITGGPLDSVNQTSNIPVSSLSPGFHKLFIRTQNTDGVWSLYEGREFYIQPSVTIPAAAQITAAEYFFDKDPGVGMGIAIATSTADSINVTPSSVSVASLSPGFHSMFVRVKNTDGLWSLYEGRSFYIMPAPDTAKSAPITAAEYFFDKDPGQGMGTAIATSTADSVNVTASAISLSALTPGFHNIFIRTKDTSGKWSLYEGRNFYYMPAVVAKSSPKIVGAEFFYDTDPGVGKGTAVTGITAGDSINVTQSLDASALPNGPHNAFIRVIDSIGHWSLYEGRSFKVLNCSVTVSASATKDSCYGGNDGTATAIASSGTSPYTYSWNTTPVQTTQTATGLTAGIYTVTATDSIGCPATATVVVGQPSQIKVNVSVVNTTCGKNNGQALATASGGTGPSYTYIWSTIPVQTGAAATGLAPGTYTVTVFDGHNCSVTATATIAASTSPSLSITLLDSSKCGQHIGKATVLAAGGTAPYTYSWNNGQTQATADSLSAGVYIVTVTDVNGCSTFIPVDITNSDGPKIGINTISEVKCYGQTNGALSVSVIGGVSPYTYSWSTGATTSGITGLAAGPYDVTVTDATGCQGVRSFSITAPSSPVSLSVSTTKAGCSTADGSATVLPAGGTPGYTYKWNNGATADSAGGLFAGTYTVIVTDANGCKDSIQAAVSSKTGPVVMVDSITDADCSTGTGGTVTLSVSGGVPSYSFQWSDGSTNQNLVASAGNYNVTVTDALGCIGTATATVPESLPAQISICMVTVDPATQTNMVIWDKSAATNISHYNIYRESTSAGVYYKIGSLPVTGQCTYTDSTAKPQIRSWRYEISQVDSCGYESPLSNPHKTMHLTANQGVGGVVNLIWDNYEGLGFGSYIIYRDTVPGVVTASDSIDEVPNTLFTYTDPTPPVAKHIFYYTSIDNPGGCTPSIMSINYHSSKSNTGNLTFTTVGMGQLNALKSLMVYPNPTTGMVNFSLNLPAMQNITVKVYNAIGQMLFVNNYGGLSGHITRQLDLSGLSKGLYIMQVIGDNSVTYRKIVLQ